jgi:hypothetical protein
MNFFSYREEPETKIGTSTSTFQDEISDEAGMVTISANAD